MKPLFQNTKIKVYRYIETGDYDEDGEPLYINKYIAEYPADFQKVNMNNDNNNTEHGAEQKNKFTINLESSANIKEEDIIFCEGKYFKVTGCPAIWNHFLNHIEVEIIELRINPEIE
ncbi:MAG: hypothetical protein ACI4RQ_06290 [Methanobrevibacter wolinii]